MAMIAAKCTNCGANIQVDETKEAGICEACGTAFITEKAINNYNTVSNYYADVVNIVNEENNDFEIVGGELKKYKGSLVNVTIPDTVKCIGKGAFKDCKWIETVSMSDSVVEIGNDAFSDCVNLKVIELSESILKIGGYAFIRCENLAKVRLPYKLKELGGSSFSGCKGLKHIELPGNLESIESYTFSDCSSLRHIELPDSLKKIDGRAFIRCTSLQNIQLPESLEVIGNAAFSGCTSLKEIVIPKSVYRIGDNDVKADGLCCTFTKCSNLNSITIKNPNLVINGSRLWLEGCPDNIIIIAPNEWKSLNAIKLNQSGCYVATCVYGSYDCPQVWTLRRFRDNTLAETMLGRAFIHTYYTISPTLVKWFGNTSWFKKMWKGTLDRMVSKLQDSGVEDTPYQDRNW